MKSSPIRNFQITLAVVIVITIILLFTVWGSIPGHALPEYAMRTGEPCATCHVSPGGGGPRTLRGMLWAARGKPDKVPDLPNILLAPGISNGDELYEIGCSSCHGKNGEGLFGVPLLNSGLPDNKIRAQILNGRIRSGMPSFQGKFTNAQLDALVTYVTGIASGAITPAPNEYPLAPGQLTCSPTSPNSSCGGN
jgi:mono/diheme cytochrome c family protein